MSKEILSFEELVEQFQEQRRKGVAPGVAEYAEQYPEHQKELLELLPFLEEMDALGKNNQETENRPSLSFPEDLCREFHLIRKLGSGGMGVVFEAVQISLNRKVAVKLLSANLAGESTQREQFEQESRVIAMLHHPNIVKVYQAGNCGDTCYYAMELIEGKGLDQYRTANLREVAKIGLQAARALAYAHSCKVMHRDIKPANLLLDADQNIHVSDFGLAFVLRNKNEMVEAPDQLCGTPRYMAPERLMHGINSFQTDQYSLGATLYELAAQMPILPQKSPQALIQRICMGPVPPLKCPEPDLAAIINKSVRFDPAGRYRSMEDFAEDLQRFLNKEPVKAHPASPLRCLSLWVRRKPAMAALSFFAGFCTLAFLGARITGYWKTAEALKLAERNASVADTALTQIFNHVSTQAPTRTASTLLSTLLPYYQGIASQRGQSVEKIAEANSIIGTSAMRAGNDPLAETAFRQLVRLRDDAHSRNQLSDAIRRQGKQSDANAISHEVVEKYADSKKPEERFEAARALQTLSTAAGDAEILRAFEILRELLQNDPENPEYRFRFASILGENPRLFRTAKISGVEPNAVILLRDLADAYPDRPEYGLELVDLMERRLRHFRRFQSTDWNDLDLTLNLANRLLGRFPNDPKVISSISSLRKSYAEALRRMGNLTGGRRETERLIGILEILFYNPEIPDTAKERLIELQIQRLELAIRDNRAADAHQMYSEIAGELDQYNGSMKAEFRKRLAGLSLPQRSEQNGRADSSSRKLPEARRTPSIHQNPF